MDIIALSLGLIPMPANPRQQPEEDTRKKQSVAAKSAAKRRIAGPIMRRYILELLQSTGPATASDIAIYFGQSVSGVRHHLVAMERKGLVRSILVSVTSHVRRWEAV